jgi:urease accessory protein
LVVQRAFYPEGDGTCHLYLLHPPGGLASGDELRVEAEANAESRVLLTTPAAGKVYRSSGAAARQTQVLRVAARACLEWLPQETIVFAGARVELTTAVHVEPGARFTAWEVLCLGRPAAGERFERGECLTRLEVHRRGRPLLVERGRYRGGSELLSAPWGLAGYPVYGTLVATAEPGWRDAVRASLAGKTEGRTAVTEFNGLLIVRCLERHGEAARRTLMHAWQALRRAQGRSTVMPRIWRT